MDSTFSYILTVYYWYPKKSSGTKIKFKNNTIIRNGKEKMPPRILQDMWYLWLFQNQQEHLQGKFYVIAV